MQGGAELGESVPEMPKIVTGLAQTDSPNVGNGRFPKDGNYR